VEVLNARRYLALLNAAEWEGISVTLRERTWASEISFSDTFLLWSDEGDVANRREEVLCLSLI
jgi:hypothetical protein